VNLSVENTAICRGLSDPENDLNRFFYPNTCREMEIGCRAFSVELRIVRHLPSDGFASVQVEELPRAGGSPVDSVLWKT
jgi:hypothetical protein